MKVRQRRSLFCRIPFIPGTTADLMLTETIRSAGYEMTRSKACEPCHFVTGDAGSKRQHPRCRKRLREEEENQVALRRLPAAAAPHVQSTLKGPEPGRDKQ
ncbi:TPA: hypothetical protein ACNUIJ_003963 [Salmonella enterica subsp. enterica serovar Derby]